MHRKEFALSTLDYFPGQPDPVSNPAPTGAFYRLDGRPFELEECQGYSMFKYGWKPAGEQYGKELAAAIAEELWLVSAGRPVIIVSAPYKYLPTASHVIAETLCREL